MAPVVRSLLLFVSVAFAGALLPLGDGGRLEPMSKYRVNLDEAPERRWDHVLSDFNSSVPLVIQYMEEQAPKAVRDLLSVIMGPLDDLLGDLGKEMRGIANYWGIDLWIVVSLNFAYEFRRLGGGPPNTTANATTTMAPVHARPSSDLAHAHPLSGLACTSIVAEDEEGTIVHGRNLDWNLPDGLRHMTVQIDFVRGGSVAFTAVTVAGYVGILTGMSRNGFSVTVNERDLGGNIIVDALAALLKKAWAPTHLSRAVLSEASTYDEAVTVLGKEELVAPAYFIAAGSKAEQGVVITRDRSAVDLWQLQPSAVPSSWYLLETNYDHWKPVYPYDDRRTYGNKYMQALGRAAAASFPGLLEVLTRWPVQNDLTTHTALMCPRNSSMTAYIVLT